MRSKGQGLTATLLMFVPLLAVPFLAAWGVPWLAAKAKTEGLELPQAGDSESLGPGVGQSKSGRHRAADLFAPITDEPVVDLQLAGERDPFAGPRTASQNPHLRNASLVVSHEDAWTDPFDEIEPGTKGSPVPRQTANASDASPQRAADDWNRNDSSGDSPAPRNFDEPSLPENSPPTNPFAEFESQERPVAQVAVNDDAFPEPNRPDPNLAEIDRSHNPFARGTDVGGLDERPDSSNRREDEAPRTLFDQSEAPASANEAKAIPPVDDRPESFPGDASEPTEPAPEALTWDTARARLKSFGITQFYLQPDPAGELYHFRCAYNPGGNSRINRLFEAEAAEPLEAVRKVLAQVENATGREN